MLVRIIVTLIFNKVVITIERYKYFGCINLQYLQSVKSLKSTSCNLSQTIVSEPSTNCKTPDKTTLHKQLETQIRTHKVYRGQY